MNNYLHNNLPVVYIYNLISVFNICIDTKFRPQFPIRHSFLRDKSYPLLLSISQTSNAQCHDDPLSSLIVKA